MQITKELNVNNDDFFDFLEKSIKFDIKNATDKEISDITQGFSYKKELKNQLNQKGMVTTTIEKYERNVCYQSKTTSNQGFNYMTFDVETIDAQNIKVSYTEEFTSSSKMNIINHKFIMNLYKKRMDRRMNLLISNIELSIKAEKGSELCQD